MRKTLLILGLLVGWSAAGRCQTAEPAAAPAAAVAATGTDMQHNPQKALLLSLLPGAGQVYNGQAWKLPIIYGAFAGVGYYIYQNYTEMVALRDDYLSAEVRDSYQYSRYQAKNKKFQIFIIAAVGVYGLNLLDAYVFGHLYDFQINDDLALQLSPSVTPDWNSRTGMAPSLQLSFRF